MAANDILVKIGADISDFSKKMSATTKQISNFGKSHQKTFDAIGRTGSALTKGITTPAVAATTALAGVAAVKGFGRLLGIDTARAKLTALGHDSESIETIVTNALDAVTGTAYGLDEAATAAASAVAAGIEPGKELTKYLGLAGDAAAIAGTDFNEMGRIFNQVQTAGRAYTGELNMLADRGIPIYQWLAEEAGVSAEAVRDMASSGEVSAEMFRKAIENNIEGAAKTIGELSFGAALKNIGSDIARIGASFLDAGGEGEGFFSTLKPLLTEFREYLSSIEGGAAELGSKFGKAFVNVINTLRDLKARYDELSPAMQDFIKNAAAFGAVFLVAIGPILKFIGFLPKLIDGFKEVEKVVKTAGKALSFFTSPVGIVILAVAGLAFLIYKYWDEIKAYTIEAWGAIRDFFTELWVTITETVISVWEGIKTYFIDLWSSIVELATLAWQTLSETVLAILQPFIDGIMNIFNGMSEGLVTLWEGIKTYFSGVWELIKNIFLGAILLIINLVTGNFEELGKNAKQIWDNIKNALNTVWEGIKQVFKGALEAIWGGVKSAWNNIKTTTSTIFNGVKSVVSTIWNGIKTFFTQTLGEIWNSVKQKFDDIKTAISDKMTEVKETIENIWDSVMGFFEGIDLKQIGKDIIDGLINGIKSKVKAVGDAVKSVTDSITGKIKSILGIKSPSRVLAQIGRWTGEGLANGIEDTTKMVDRASDMLGEAAIPDKRVIDMSYATPSGVSSTLTSAVNGTVDVNTREDVIARAIDHLGNKLENLRIEMDRREFGRVVSDEVTNQRDASVRGGGRRRI